MTGEGNKGKGATEQRGRIKIKGCGYGRRRDEGRDKRRRGISIVRIILQGK